MKIKLRPGLNQLTPSLTINSTQLRSCVSRGGRDHPRHITRWERVHSHFRKGMDRLCCGLCFSSTSSLGMAETEKHKTPTAPNTIRREPQRCPFGIMTFWSCRAVATIAPKSVSEQEIEERRTRFRADVQRLSASSVVDRHVIFGDCYILDKDSYFALKEQNTLLWTTHEGDSVDGG